jgi:hypothetical protein
MPGEQANAVMTRISLDLAKHLIGGIRRPFENLRRRRRAEQQCAGNLKPGIDRARGRKHIVNAGVGVGVTADPAMTAIDQLDHRRAPGGAGMGYRV